MRPMSATLPLQLPRPWARFPCRRHLTLQDEVDLITSGLNLAPPVLKIELHRPPIPRSCAGGWQAGPIVYRPCCHSSPNVEIALSECYHLSKSIYTRYRALGSLPQVSPTASGPTARALFVCWLATHPQRICTSLLQIICQMISQQGVIIPRKAS